MSNKKIELVGPFPPPYGGVSIHIQRLLKHLSLNNLKFIVHNHGMYSNKEELVYTNKKSPLWYIKYLFNKTSNIVHFHQTLHGIHFLYWYIYCKLNNNQVLVTIHNEDLLKQNVLMQRINLFFLKKTRVNKLFVVSYQMHSFLKNHSIESIYLPAYIPADFNNKIRQKDSKFNIFCNIANIMNRSYINKYGLDLLLKLLSSYKDDNIRLYIFIGVNNNIDMLNSKIFDMKLEKRVHIKINKNMVEHLYYADVLIRANRDDAYGVSIQEAHDSKVPTISSDICMRPSGTHLFRSGSFEHLKNIFDSVLYSTKDEMLKDIEKTTYHLQLIDIYINLMKGNT